MESIDLLYVLMLFFSGIAAFLLSTISGGGGALLLIPLLNFTLGPSITAPVLNLGTFIGRPSRLIIFWKNINWKICLYYAPAATGSAWLASWLFTEVRIEWLKIVIALFLISTIFQFRFGKRKSSFQMKTIYFLPLGILVSFLGTLTGALGPVLNPFYLNAGIEKEELIATKTANSFFVGISQISGYAFFGLLYGELWVYGISLGLGAAIGSVVGKKFLSRMKNSTFRVLLIIFMVFSGILMLISLIKI